MPAQSSTRSVSETIVLVNTYLREARINSDGNENLTEVADRLGWTLQQLASFRRDYASLLNYDDELAVQGGTFVSLPDPVLPPSGPDLLSPPDGDDLEADVPTGNEIASAVAAADRNLLKHGLKNMGFTEEEAMEAEALQQFNRKHFRESMEIVASNGMRTSMKLAIQQRHVELRLTQVREKIESYMGFESDEREYWAREERLLMRQFVELGELINQIQDTWFKGASMLAVANMRARGSGGSATFNMQTTQRTNKPGFQPALESAPE